jgi:hypothetical protein
MPFLVSGFVASVVVELDVEGVVGLDVEDVVAGSLAAGVEDDVDEPELELPQPATPSATRTKPSVSHLVGTPALRAADDLVSMRPPWWGGSEQRKNTGRRLNATDVNDASTS